MIVWRDFIKALALFCDPFLRRLIQPTSNLTELGEFSIRYYGYIFVLFLFESFCARWLSYNYNERQRYPGTSSENEKSEKNPSALGLKKKLTVLLSLECTVA